MSNDLSKLGIGGVLRLPLGDVASKLGLVAPMRLTRTSNLLTKAGGVAVLRTSTRHEITKAATVAVLRPAGGLGRRRMMFTTS